MHAIQPSPPAADSPDSRNRPTPGHPSGRASLLLSLLLCAALSPTAAWAGNASVSWVEPDRFSDIGRNAVDRERVLAQLGDYLGKLSARLPQGQTLKVEVTDVDLAGEINPFGAWRWDDVRVLRGRVDWPRISLRWTLSAADGSTLRQGQDDLSDMAYFFRPQPEHLGHEKRLLKRWFDERVATP